MDLQPNKIDGIIKPITNKRISASEWNQLVGSCMEFIYEAGYTPDPNDNKQFLNAFIQIAQDIGAVGANVDLSNLSATGENHFADPSFSNINSNAKKVVYDRAFNPLNVTVAQGNVEIAATYTLTDLPDDNVIRLAVFSGFIQTTQLGGSSMVISTDVCSYPVEIASTNNGFGASSSIILPVKRQVTISFTSIVGGVGPSGLWLKGYF